MSQVLRRSTNLISRQLDDERLLFDSSGRAHRLDAAMAAVWDACDGSRTASDVVTATDLDREQVDHAVDALRGVGLLEGGSAVSRRVVLRAGAVAGGAAVALPMLTSIVAPVAAAAASTSGGGGTGSTNTPPPGSVDYSSLSGDTGDGYYVGQNPGGFEQIDSQVFPVNTTGTLTGVALNVDYFGGDHNGTLRATLCVDTPAGPGTELQSATFNSASLPTFTFGGSGEFVTVYFTFAAGVPVTAGQTYQLKLSIDQTDPTATDLWETPSTDNSYTFYYSFDGGTTYNAQTGQSAQLATYVQ